LLKLDPVSEDERQAAHDVEGFLLCAKPSLMNDRSTLCCSSKPLKKAQM